MPQAPNDGLESAERLELADENPKKVLSRVRNRIQRKLDSVNAVVADLVRTLGVIDAAEGRIPPERPREAWTLDQLREWLATTRCRDGATLESKLEGRSLDAQVQKYVRAYAEGERGFSLDPATLRFRSEEVTLTRLQKGIECGAITGLVIEAYPDAAALVAMAHRLSPEDPATELDRLLREPVIEFLIRHFQARGGRVNEEEDRPEHWRTIKWPRKAKPIWKAFHEQTDARGRLIVVDYLSNRTSWASRQEDHATVYAALDDQPTVRDVLGTASLVFTNTNCELPKRGKTLGPRGVVKFSQGRHLLFEALIRQSVDTLNPAEYLALVAAISTPGTASTYPEQGTSVLLGGVDRGHAVHAYSGSGGLDLDWMNLGSAWFGSRVRSVVRGIPDDPFDSSGTTEVVTADY